MTRVYLYPFLFFFNCRGLDFFHENRQTFKDLWTGGSMLYTLIYLQGFHTLNIKFKDFSRMFSFIFHNVAIKKTSLISHEEL